MRILVLTTSFPRVLGDSAGNFIYNQIKEIEKGGNKVTVLAPHDSNSRYVEGFGSVDVVRFPYNIPNWESVAYGGGIKENVKGSFMAKLNLPIFLLSFSLYALFMSRKYDIVHAHWLTISGFVGVFCKLITRKPLVVTVHGTDLRETNKNFLYSSINKLVLRSSDRIITVNTELKKRLKPLGVSNNKVSTIYNGINNLDSLVRLPLKKKSLANILFVSRLVEIKNLRLVIEALGHLVPEIPHITLTVIGDGNQRRNLEILVKGKGLEKQVSFQGERTFEEIIRFYEVSNLFILPQKAEGFGLSLLESMAAGVPTISGKVIGIEEMIREGETGFIVELNKPKVLAELIEKLINDRALLEKVALSARNKVKKLSWENQSKKILEVYDLGFHKNGKLSNSISS